MSVTRDEIVKIARLAHLRFEGAELERFSEEFATILGYFESLDRLELSGIEPTAHVAAGDAAVPHEYRPDQVQAGLPPDEATAQAPEKVAGHFVVPKFIG